MTTKIAVLGNFSGRNAGDNAILGNLVRDVAAEIPDAEFLVPTLSKAAVMRICKGYNVKPMGLMPWHGALKIFGLSTLRAMVNADCVLITDNILFDKSFYNPAFNYLSTIALLAPLCHSRDIPVLLYNASVGPITTPIGVAALRRVLRKSPFGILRDATSRELLARVVGPVPRIVPAADCALNTEPPAADRLAAVAKGFGILDDGRPKLGLNINTYVDAWKSSAGSLTKTEFLRQVAEVFDTLVTETGAQPVFFVTQVMDTGITMQLREAMKSAHAAPVVVVSPECNYREIAGLLGEMDLLIAMRTHALILATAMHTPALNINTYPKSAAYMETVGLGRWNLDIADLTRESLLKIGREAWQERSATRSTLDGLVPAEKAKAKGSAKLVRDLLAKTA